MNRSHKTSHIISNKNVFQYIPMLSRLLITCNSGELAYEYIRTNGHKQGLFHPTGQEKNRVGRTEIQKKETVKLQNIVYKAHLLFWELQRAFLYISLVQNPKCLEPGEKKGWKNLREHYPPPSCCWNCYLNC